jgi:hypothetical protein
MVGGYLTVATGTTCRRRRSRKRSAGPRRSGS